MFAQTTAQNVSKLNKKIDISVIIVSYNTAELTIQTINSVLASAEKYSKASIEIIVVDNNSSDSSVTAVKKLQAKSPMPIHLVQNKTNDGFAAANNQGINLAKGEYLFLLNSDTIVAKNALKELHQTFVHHPHDDTTADLSSYNDKTDRIGIVAAGLKNPDGTVQHQGGSFPTLLSLSSHMLLLDDIPILGKLLPSTQATGMRSVSYTDTALISSDWVGGTAIFFPRSLIEEIGLLDDNIFMYGEDVEFCMRAKNHHYDIVINPAAEVIHFGNASGSSKNAIIGELRGYLYIWSKHKPHWQYSLVKAMIVAGCRLRTLLFGTILRNKQKAAIYTEARQAISSL